jgi:siroheme synthase
LEDEALDWRSLAGPRQTVVFYMGVSHLDRIVAKLRDAGAKSDHPAAVVERATLPEQRTLRGTLETIVEVARRASVTSPALLIIGDVTTFMTTGVATLDVLHNSDTRKDGSMSHGAFV